MIKTKLAVFLALLVGMPTNLQFAEKAQAMGTRPDKCMEYGTSLVAFTYHRRIHICKEGVTLADYSIAYGRLGIHKRMEGDRRTPIGTYLLSPPRPSKQYGVFIHIGYPTKEEVDLGYTGSNIGIHGPDRRFLWAGPLNTWINWTQGCIAVANDEIVTYIGEFVKQHRNLKIHIIDDSPYPEEGAAGYYYQNNSVSPEEVGDEDPYIE